MAVYITGDTHRDFQRIFDFCNKNNTTQQNDVLIILGDAGINYYLNNKDYRLKQQLSKLPITIFCIHGNHEERPENINTYIYMPYYKHNNLFGSVYMEKEFPNLIFGIDNTFYEINNEIFYVLGGAYSVDKFFRLMIGSVWFQSEQNKNLQIKLNQMLDVTPNTFIPIEFRNRKINILSHTCPYSYRPIEAFLPNVDQTTVDSSMEMLLDKIIKTIQYEKLYCGHWHIDKQIDKIRFFFNDIIQI